MHYHCINLNLMNISIKSPILKTAIRFPSTNRKDQHSIPNITRRRFVDDEDLRRKYLKEKKPSRDYTFNDPCEYNKLMEAIDVKDKVIGLHYQLIVQISEKLKAKDQNSKNLMEIIKILKGELIKHNIALPDIPSNPLRGETTIIEEHAGLDYYQDSISKIMSYQYNAIDIPTGNKYISHYDYYINEILQSITLKKGVEIQKKQVRTHAISVQRQSSKKSNRSFSINKKSRTTKASNIPINQTLTANTELSNYGSIDSQFRNITNYGLIECIVDEGISNTNSHIANNIQPIKALIMNSLSLYFVCKTLNMGTKDINTYLGRLVNMITKILNIERVIIYLDYGTEYLVAKCISGKSGNPYQIAKGRGRPCK